MTVDSLLAVLHLAIARIVNGLMLISNPLETSFHSTGTIIKEIPVTVDSLLTVLHLSVTGIVDCFMLFGNPLESCFVMSVVIEQIPLSVDSLLASAHGCCFNRWYC